jgi:putative transposase
MPRLPRLIAAGVPLHVIQRGNNRSVTFFAVGDYRCYRELLLDASHRFGCAIHAYAFMTNHVHLLLTPDNERGPARMMQAIGRVYVRYVNARYQRTGTLWEGRYRSSLVDSDRYLLACFRYIELNPVRAGIVKHPIRYHWSSYGHNAHGKPDSLITHHAIYQALASSETGRQAAYRALFETRLDSGTLDQIRGATNRGTMLGDEPFREQIEARLGTRVRRLPHGGDRRSKAFSQGVRVVDPS